jgi:tetratricopeptide (TPR) repeat protein
MASQAKPWGLVIVVSVLALVLVLGAGAIVALGFRSPDALREAAAAYARGDWPAAAELAGRRLASRPNDMAAVRLRARSLVRLGRNESAMALYNRKLAGQTLEAEDHFLQGIVWSGRGQVAAARQAWESALAAEPNHAETLDALVQSQANAQQYDDAVRTAERLVKVPGWEGRGNLKLGVLRVDMDDPAGAAAAFQTALAREPSVLATAVSPNSFRKLIARTFLRVGTPAPARAQLQAALGTGADPEASWLMSRALLQEHKRDAAMAALAHAGSYRDDNPTLVEPAAYAGEERCVGCHRALHQAVLGSRHSRTFYRAKELEELPLPPEPVADPDDPKVKHSIARVDGKLEATTTIGSDVYKVLVEYAVGTTDRYLTPLGRDEQGQSRALRLSYHRAADGSGWGPTAGDRGHTGTVEEVRGQRIDERGGVPRCLYCHTTDSRAARDGRPPLAADQGIGCERCHGPGGNHLAAVAAKLPDLAIASPARATPAQVNHLCNQCHILGELEPSTSREDPEWVRSQGASMPWSRCYTETAGALSCVTCHDPHRNAEKAPGHYEAKCLGCHTATAGAADASSFRRVVCSVNAKSDCISCHMPKVPFPILHTSLTDHYIRVHRAAGK